MSADALYCGTSLRKNVATMITPQKTSTAMKPCWMARASESLSAANTWSSKCCACCIACAATEAATWSCRGPGGTCAAALCAAKCFAVFTTVSRYVGLTSTCGLVANFTPCGVSCFTVATGRRPAISLASVLLTTVPTMATPCRSHARQQEHTNSHDERADNRNHLVAF